MNNKMIPNDNITFEKPIVLLTGAPGTGKTMYFNKFNNPNYFKVPEQAIIDFDWRTFINKQNEFYWDPKLYNYNNKGNAKSYQYVVSKQQEINRKTYKQWKKIFRESPHKIIADKSFIDCLIFTNLLLSLHKRRNIILEFLLCFFAVILVFPAIGYLILYFRQSSTDLLEQLVTQYGYKIQVIDFSMPPDYHSELKNINSKIDINQQYMNKEWVDQLVDLCLKYNIKYTNVYANQKYDKTWTPGFHDIKYITKKIIEKNEK